MIEHPPDRTPWPDAMRIGEVAIVRRIDRPRDTIVVTGDFRGIAAAYEEHIRRWIHETDPLGLVLMRQGLGAAILHLSCRPPGEVVGWTINIRQPPTNLFITGDNEQRTVTGRIFTEAVKTAESSRMFVQVSTAGSPIAHSTIPVEGLDIFLMFDQFYRHSEQTPARFFEETEHTYLMIYGLPDVDEEWLEDLSRDEAIAIAHEELKLLETAVYRFQCGCNPERIHEIVVALYHENPDQLFSGDPGVEVLCPRCGRRWWVGRREFDEALANFSPPEPPATGPGAGPFDDPPLSS